MPFNAFQRNAFQRNAFQIVYDFAPVVDGGLVLGGNVTCRFHSGVVPPPPVVVIGTGGRPQRRSRSWRNIFARPRHYRAKVKGGLELGGKVRSYFYHGETVEVIPEPVAYVAIVTGGLVLGTELEVFFVSVPPEPLVEISAPISQPEPEPVAYKAMSTLGGGVGLRSGVRARFQSNPPPPEYKPRVWTFFNRHKAQQQEEDELLLMEIL